MLCKQAVALIKSTPAGRNKTPQDRPVLRIRIRLDPLHFKKPNPDTHQKKSRIQNHFKVKIKEQRRLKMKPYNRAGDAQNWGVKAQTIKPWKPVDLWSQIRPLLRGSGSSSTNERRNPDPQQNLCGSGSLKQPARHLDIKTDHPSFMSA
jgi:hypothetical protein